MFKTYEKKLREDLENLLPQGEFDDNVVNHVMYCLQPAVRSDITVFNLSSDSNLSETILQSICQCKSIDFEEFSVQFNIDYSTSKIIKKKRK